MRGGLGIDKPICPGRAGAGSRHGAGLFMGLCFLRTMLFTGLVFYEAVFLRGCVFTGLVFYGNVL